MHYAHIAWQDTFVNSHKHTGLLHPLWLSYGMVKYRRHASKFTTSSTIQRKAAPHRSKALSQRRHFVTLSTDKCVLTLMWFVWNSETCISFFYLPSRQSLYSTYTQTIIFIFLFLLGTGHSYRSLMTMIFTLLTQQWGLTLVPPLHIECPPLLLEYNTAYYPDLSQYNVLFHRAIHHRYICVHFTDILNFLV